MYFVIKESFTHCLKYIHIFDHPISNRLTKFGRHGNNSLELCTSLHYIQLIRLERSSSKTRALKARALTATSFEP